MIKPTDVKAQEQCFEVQQNVAPVKEMHSPSLPPYRLRPPEKPENFLTKDGLTDSSTRVWPEGWNVGKAHVGGMGTASDLDRDEADKIAGPRSLREHDLGGAANPMTRWEMCSSLPSLGATKAGAAWSVSNQRRGSSQQYGSEEH